MFSTDIRTPQQVDEAMQAFSQVIWEAHEVDARLGPDATGRKLSQYADEWLLPPDVQHRLTEVRDKALAQQAANDPAGLDQSLAEARHILQSQAFRATLIDQYAAMLERLLRDSARLDGFAQRLSTDEQAAARLTMEAPARQIQARLLSALQTSDEALFVRELENTFRDWAEYMVPINVERQRLAGLVSRSDRARGVPAKGRDRQSPCPPPATQTSGAARFTTVRDSISAPEYPIESRRLGYSGTVILTLHVAASGCMTRSEIYASVGIDELDDTALAWSETLRFLPAENDGKAVDTVHEIAVTFRFTD